MRWADPELLRLLWFLPFAVLAGWLMERRRASLERALGDPPALRTRSGAAGLGARWWRRLLVIAALGLAIVALARPQAGFRSVTTTSRGIDLVVALDLSRSMDARDVRPDRLRAAKREAASLVTALEGSSIGLVGFAGESEVLSPLSTDLDGLVSLIESEGDREVGATPQAARRSAEGDRDRERRGESVRRSARRPRGGARGGRARVRDGSGYVPGRPDPDSG